MYATSMAFIEDLVPQKIAAKIIKHDIFCGTGFYKRRGKYKKTGRANKILTKVLPGESIIL